MSIIYSINQHTCFKDYKHHPYQSRFLINCLYDCKIPTISSHLAGYDERKTCVIREGSIAGPSMFHSKLTRQLMIIALIIVADWCFAVPRAFCLSVSILVTDPAWKSMTISRVIKGLRSWWRSRSLTRVVNLITIVEQ